MYTGIELARVNGMNDPDPFGFGLGVRYYDNKLSFLVICHGTKWRITIPVEVVHEEMDRTFAEHGIWEPAAVGEASSCNGLFRRVKRVFRKKGLLGRLAKHALLGPAALAIGRQKHKGKTLLKHALLGPAAFVVGEDLEYMSDYEPADVGRRRRHGGGLFGAIKRIGRGVLRGVKAVVKSKAFGAIVAASAMIMPAVGGPALAALTTAKVAMKVLEAAKRGHPGANVRRQMIGHNVAQLQRSGAPMARLALAAFQTNQR